MAISKKLRKKVFEKSNGHCWYCGCGIAESNFNVDHIEPVRRDVTEHFSGCLLDGTFKKHKKVTLRNPELNTLDNMAPTCRSCNQYKSVYSLEQFRQLLSRQVDSIRRNNSVFRVVERFGLISEKRIPIVFWFEKNIND